MTSEQRGRMIQRFHNRKMASNPFTLEHHLCTSIVLGLLYGGGVRVINGIARRTRSDAKAAHRARYKIEERGND